MERRGLNRHRVRAPLLPAASASSGRLPSREIRVHGLGDACDEPLRKQQRHERKKLRDAYECLGQEFRHDSNTRGVGQLTPAARELVISALILFGVDRLELFVDPWVGIKRTSLVAFPASFASTAVDSLR